MPADCFLYARQDIPLQERNLADNVSSVVSQSSLRWTIFLVLAGLGMACGLFYYGLQVPFFMRVRGDAAEYINIARQFTSFSEAVNYLGARTPGFPLFEYLFFSLDVKRSLLSQVNHICFTLFLIHELTSLWVCVICVKCRLFAASSIYFGLLFFMLAAYPAMVMHTTTPLTDTFGMDLLLIGFSCMAWAGSQVEMAWTRVLVSGVISGGVLGYAIWVRPGYWIGVVGFLAGYILLTGVSRVLSLRWSGCRQMTMCLVISITVTVVMLPLIHHDKSERSYILNVMRSVNAGLTGVRTVWNYPRGVSPLYADFPVYPDAFLVNHLHARCSVTAVIGRLNRDNSNLLSCLYYAPHWAVLYFLKKITGLFDIFRMTPYTETITPLWYLWLARVFSSIAFVGFWILLWEGAKGAYQLLVFRKPVSALFAAAWFFCLTMVSLHSILHVEERYAFSWIPFCIIAFFLKIKMIQEKNYSSHLRWAWFNFAELVIIAYFIQISVWDYGMRYHIVL